jgi:ADP-heptose:LPS heptosyltransferase
VNLVVAGATLAVHPGALGDVLLAIPALRALRDAGGRLTLAAQPRIASLLVALGEADEACDFESLRLDALFAGARDARLPAAERVVCWFGARDPDFVRRLAAICPRAIVAASVSPGHDVWQHLLATVGVQSARLDVARVSDALIVEGRAALDRAGSDGARRVVVVHPGAGGVAKRWPAVAFADTLARLVARDDVEIVVHEGPADAEAAAALLARLPSARRLREPALPALAGVLARCAAYIGNDSGVSHLAAAVGAPAVVLFAAANLAWRPWARAARVLTVAIERVEAGDVRSVRGALDAMLR